MSVVSVLLHAEIERILLLASAVPSQDGKHDVFGAAQVLISFQINCSVCRLSASSAEYIHPITLARRGQECGQVFAQYLAHGSSLFFKNALSFDLL